jgi:hypothetical protein
MWVTVHGDERAERMTDLTWVKLVIDAQAAAFPPVASWRATRCSERQPITPSRFVAIIPLLYAPNSAIDTLSVRSKEVTCVVTMRIYRSARRNKGHAARYSA